MVKILVKKRIATGKIAEKLEKIAACSQGVCIPIAAPNGDFAFDTTEDIIEEEMNKH